MTRLRLTPRARDDIDGIVAFTEERWGGEQVRIYVDRLDRAFGMLLANPRLGVLRKDLGSGYRSMQVESHIVFYRFRSDEVLIVRVLHSQQDVRRHLPDVDRAPSGRRSRRKASSEGES